MESIKTTVCTSTECVAQPIGAFVFATEEKDIHSETIPDDCGRDDILFDKWYWVL